MPIATQKIMPCLWFDTQAEDAAKHYVSIFKNSKIGKIGRYGKEGKEIHGKEAGSVMAVEFEIEGQKFVALNGGPQFKFDEAISFQIFVRYPGGSRLFLEQADRRRQGRSLRLAEGQVRAVVAGRSDIAAGIASETPIPRRRTAS